MVNVKIDWRGLAINKVQKSPLLKQYSDIIFYNWPDMETHLQWIVTGSEEEIAAWAAFILENEKR